MQNVKKQSTNDLKSGQQTNKSPNAGPSDVKGETSKQSITPDGTPSSPNKGVPKKKKSSKNSSSSLVLKIKEKLQDKIMFE